MRKSAVIEGLAIVVLLAGGVQRSAAQPAPADASTLRERAEQRFEVLPLREGVALRPRDPSRGIRSIEVTRGQVAIDGQPATGAELRDRLGGVDADLVLELSYLSDAGRRTMFDSTASREPAAAPPFERPETARPRGDRRQGKHDVRFGANITVADGEVVDGDVVAIGGSVQVDGDVRGDVVAVGGSVTLGPTATVEDNVVVVGGALRRDPGARIGGRISEVGVGALNAAKGRWRRNPLWFWGSTVGSAFALVGTLTRVAILCLLSALVVLFGQAYMERAAVHAANQPLKAGAIGLLTQLLFVPLLVILVVMLVVTVVGIPLLLLIPFLILGLAVVGLVGFASVAYRLGGWFSQRTGWSGASPYLTTVAGVVLLLSPVVLARVLGAAGGLMLPFTFVLALIGAVVEYLAWTVGFGAVALTRFSRRPFAPDVPLGPSATA